MGEHGALIERKGAYLLLEFRQPCINGSTAASCYAVVTPAGECIRRESNLDDARAWLETLVRDDMIACAINTPAATRAGRAR